MVRQYKSLLLACFVVLSLIAPAAFAGSIADVISITPDMVYQDLADPSMDIFPAVRSIELTINDERIYAGFLHGSPEALKLTVADTAVFKLNKVPWQYFQA